MFITQSDSSVWGGTCTGADPESEERDGGQGRHQNVCIYIVVLREFSEGWGQSQMYREKTRRWPNVGLMLDQTMGRNQPKIGPTPVFASSAGEWGSRRVGNMYGFILS